MLPLASVVGSPAHSVPNKDVSVWSGVTGDGSDLTRDLSSLPWPAIDEPMMGPDFTNEALRAMSML